MRDFDAIGALILGLLVFGVLAVTPAWSAERYVSPTIPEQVCVNYISFLTVLRTSQNERQREVAANAIKELGLGKAALDAIDFIDKGNSSAIVYPITYKTCMAKWGDAVV